MPCVTGRVTVLVLAEEAAVQALCMAISMPDVLLERLADQATNFALKLLDLCSVEEPVGVQQALVVKTLTTGGAYVVPTTWCRSHSSRQHSSLLAGASSF